ncbi:hypothetical protein NDI56_10920 [Haloarcula sp. S1CR25-12]|uniref:Uncharacterized protein n=1 Tax=Haloarcula saliterrae TaxID=2950534 RepID=A0ABU2FCB5_9EURY|nr:DUF4350 domain-containing protein [Haloarcula sp. S1CR25-12]MDS0259905.1 hypothetical protein [Haloarcula sp. S1CR25-12]
MSSAVKRVGVFLGALVLAIAVGSLFLGVGGQSAPTVNEANASAFNADDSVASVPEETGELSMSANGDGKVVVIDTARSSSVTPETVAPMAAELTESGATVKYNTGSSSFGSSGLNATLQEADAYIVFGTQQEYTDSDIAGIQAFSDAGGRVILMNEPQGQVAGLGGLFGGGSIGAPSPLLPLTSQYGFTYDNGYLYNMADNSNNYRNIYATPSGDSTLTDGVNRVVLHEAVSINGGESALTATEGTTLSSTRRAETYGVLVREGNVVAVGDTSIMDQEYVYRADNEVLVSNLLDFMVSGDKSPEDVPRTSGGFGGGGGGGGFGGGEFGNTTPDSPTNDTEPIP